MAQTSYPDWVYWLADRAARGLIWGMLRLPYRTRLAVSGRLLRIAGRVSGHHRRAMAQLAYVFPDMPLDRRRAITGGALDNAGRSFVENYSTTEQMARARDWLPEGPGWPDVEAARQNGRAIIFVSGHFGNYQAARAAMNVRGYAMGGLYRPMNNPYFNEHYVRTIEAVGGTAYARGRRGLAAFLKALQAGANVAILLDQYVHDGPRLDFLGKPAPTSVSAAEMALKYDALLVPIHAERLEDGESFRVVVDTPIPHTDPITMTRAFNDFLSALVQRRPEQWFWLHRRWKPGRQAEADALEARTASHATDEQP